MLHRWLQIAAPVLCWRRRSIRSSHLAVIDSVNNVVVAQPRTTLRLSGLLIVKTAARSSRHETRDEIVSRGDKSFVDDVDSGSQSVVVAVDVAQSSLVLFTVTP
jgi:hypothetical protein